MTGIILENITSINDLAIFSKAYTKGLIKVNISKLARDLNKDRKTIKKYLEEYTPKETRDRVKYLDEYREYIIQVLSDKYQSFDYIDNLFKYLKSISVATSIITPNASSIHLPRVHLLIP